MSKYTRIIYKTVSVSLLLSGAFILGRLAKLPNSISNMLTTNKEKSVAEKLNESQIPTSIAAASAPLPEQVQANPVLQAKMYKSSGDILRSQNDLTGAAASYRSALKLSYDDTRLRARLELSLAETLMAAGDLSAAEIECQKGLALTHSDSRVKGYLYKSLGTILKKRGDLMGAHDSFKAGVGLTHIYDRLAGMLHANLGDTLFEMARVEEAFAHYETALNAGELDPSLRSHILNQRGRANSELVKSYISEGEALCASGDAEGALAKYEGAQNKRDIPSDLVVAIQKGIDSASMLKIKGQVAKADEYLMANEREKALSIYETALLSSSLSGNMRGQIHYKIGALKEANCDMEGALSAFNIALSEVAGDTGLQHQIQIAKNGLLTKTAQALLNQAKNELAAGFLDSAGILFKQGLAVQTSDIEVRAELQNGLREVSNRHANMLFERAEKYQQIGKIDEAITAYREGIALGVTPTELLAKIELNMGDLLTEKNHFTEALQIYQAALAAGSSDDALMAILHLKTGDLYILSGDGAGATNHYASALALNPSMNELRGMLFNNLGRALLMQNKIESALGAIAQGLDIQGISFDLRQEMEKQREVAAQTKAKLLKHTGYSLYMQATGAPQAVAITETVPVAAPESLLIQASRLFESGKLEQAISLYEQCLVKEEIESETKATLILNLGRAHLKMGNNGQSERIFKEGLAEAGANLATKAALLDELGTLYKTNGRLAEAIGCYKEAIALNQEDVSLTRAIALRLSSAYIEKGEYDLAYEFYKMGEGKSPALKEAPAAPQKKSEPNGIKATIATYLEAGNYEKAAELYQQIIATETNPKRKAVMEYNLGNILLDAKNIESALECYKRAISYSFKDRGIKAHIWNNMGHAYDLLGNKDEALDCFKSGLESAPKDHTSTLSLGLNLGLALQGFDRQTEAIQAYQVALLSINKDKNLRASIHENLAGALALSGEIESSIENFESTLVLREGDKESSAKIFGKLAHLYQKAGDLTRAASCAEKALELGVSDRAAKIELYRLMGFACFKNGQMQESARYYNQSQMLQQEIASD